MKPGKLYIKIFLSFLLVLIVTEILVLGLFGFTGRRGFRSRIEGFAQSQAMLTKELIEERINSEPDMGLAENQSLKSFLVRLGEIYGARIWLADATGNAVLKSFSGSIPDDIEAMPNDRAVDVRGFKRHRHFKKGWTFYLAIPAEIGKGQMGSLHIFFDKIEPSFPERGFALGLAGIGLVIAVLVIPISRLITNRIKKLRESALQIAEGDLSHRVSVEGRDEIGELARSFNRMADKLERMVRGGRELTANISHELRSPLARIRIAQELLRESWRGGNCKDCERHLDSVGEDIEELDRLIGNILVLSKLDIREASLNRERIDLSGILDELLERFKPVMSDKRLKVVTDLSFCPLVSGDGDALRTALSNILDNAVKFAPEKGTVRVTIHSEGDGLYLSVTNSFQPLSEKDLTRIFEPFYRAEGTVEAGSGLGLVITKKIIERHGGSIEAANSADGLAIHIHLPMVDPEGERNGL